MQGAFPNNSYHLPIYRKALEIFKISRAVAAYFSEDKNIMELSYSARPRERFAGNLIADSLQLAPGIASAASASSSASRLQRIRQIRKAAKKLKKQCSNLEFSGVKEVEFVNLLRKEISQFDRMVADWFKLSK